MVEIVDPHTLSDMGLSRAFEVCVSQPRTKTLPERQDLEASLENRWGERCSCEGFSDITGKDDGLLDMAFIEEYPNGATGNVTGKPIASRIKPVIISSVFSLFSYDCFRVRRETLRSPCSLSCQILGFRSVDRVENVVLCLLHS